MLTSMMNKCRALASRLPLNEMGRMGAALVVGAALWATVGSDVARSAAAAVADDYTWDGSADESKGSARWFARAALDFSGGDLARAERRLQRALAQVRAAHPRH